MSSLVLYIGIKKSNVIKVLAIQKTLQLSIDCSYASCKGWIVEFDSNNIIFFYELYTLLERGIK